MTRAYASSTRAREPIYTAPNWAIHTWSRRLRPADNSAIGWSCRVRVLLLHQAFASGREAGGTRHWELGSRLPRYGHHLTVVASAVSYLTGTAGYSGGDDETEVDVIRVPALSMHHRGFVWRIIAFLWFALA